MPLIVTRAGDQQR